MRLRHERWLPRRSCRFPLGEGPLVHPWIEFFQAYGVWGLFLLAFLESSVFPVPPDVLLIWMVLKDWGEPLGLTAICTFGSALGGVGGYGLGRWGGRPLLQRFFPPTKVEAAERLYDRYGVWAVAIAGFTPIPYKLFTISSGVLRFRLLPFFVASLLSRGARFSLVALLTFRYGDQVLAQVDRWGFALLAALGGGLALYGARAWRRRRRERGSDGAG